MLAELKVFVPRAVWTVLKEIGPDFERETSTKLSINYGLSGEYLKKINAGEPFDVISAPPPALEGLVRDGKVLASSKVNLVRSEVGVIVRAGSPKPDISSVEAFKQTLLKAQSITYLPLPGVPQMLERLGLKEAIASKTRVPDSDISTELVAKGEVELAVVVITQAFTTPGVELVGTLPRELQQYGLFGVAISSTTQVRGLAQKLVDTLRSPRAIEIMKSQGMEPM